MKLQKVMLSCALVFSAAACGGSDEDFMEKSVVMMEGLAKAVESAGGDCGKMATNVEGFVTKNEGLMKELKAKGEELEEGQGQGREDGEGQREVQRPDAEGDARDDGHDEVRGRSQDEGDGKQAPRPDVRPTDCATKRLRSELLAAR